MLMLCAMRSHDKQALRRLSTAANRQGEIQNQMIEISMVPLDFSEIQLLMASVLGFPKKTIPETLCTDVFQRTGGLPVYVVQMLETMKRKKTVEIGEDGLLRWTAAGRKDQVSFIEQLWSNGIYWRKTHSFGNSFRINVSVESCLFKPKWSSDGRDILEPFRWA